MTPFQLLNLLLGLALFSPLGGRAADSGLPRPYSPYENFLQGQSLPTRIAELRANLQKRRAEVIGFVGKSEGKRDKLVIAYDEALKNLDSLAVEQRPERRIELSRNVSELDYALKTTGGPRTIHMMASQIANLFRTWSLPRVSDLASEAPELYDPESNKALGLQDYATKDLSLYDPSPASRIWRRPKNLPEIDLEENFYGGGSLLQEGIESEFPEGPVYLDEVKRSQANAKIEVFTRTKKNKKRQYTFKFGRESFADPTVSSLMALVGFSTDVVKHVRHQKVYITGQSIAEFKRDVLSYYKPENLLMKFDLNDHIESEGRDEGGNFIVFKDGQFEADPKELLRVGSWGYRDLGHDRLREVRGLMIFNLWISNTDIRDDNTKVVLKDTGKGYELHLLQHDSSYALGGIISEKTERFYYDVVKKKVSFLDLIRLNPQALNLLKSKSKEAIVFTHIGPEANPLAGKITFADGRWMTRWIAQVTRPQMEEAVRLGGWPPEVGQLLLEKLITRRNDLVQAFELNDEFPPMPATRTLTTEGGLVKNGHLLNGKIPGYAHDFGNYYSELFRPIRLGFKRLMLTGAQMAVGSFDHVRLEGVEFGINDGPVAEVIAGLGRTITERAYPIGESDRDVWGKRGQPETDEDRFLVEDSVKIGFRGGFGYLFFGDGTLTVQYRLVQPARTRDEALMKNRQLIDFTLPYNVLRAQLPKRYVLMREIFIEGAGRMRVLPAREILSVGIEASASGVLLSRVTVDHKSSKRFVLSEDRTPYRSLQFRGLLGALGLIRYAFAGAEKQFGGKINGASYIVTDQDLQNDARYGLAISRVISRGNFSKLEDLKSPVLYSGPVSQSSGHLTLPPFYQYETRFNSERIRQTDSEKGMSSGVMQHRAHSRSKWWFLDNGESQQLEIFSTAPDHGEQSTLEGSRIELQYKIRDIDATAKEVGDGYLRFIRALALKDFPGSELYPFTPELHSHDGRYKRLNVFVTLQLCGSFLKKLEQLTPEKYWPALQQTLGASSADFSQGLKKLRSMDPVKGASVLMEKDKGYASAFWHSQLFLGDLAKIRNHHSAYEKLKYLTKALRSANYRGAHTFDPSVVATLNRLSEGNFFLHAVPARPQDHQSYFPGGRDPKPIEIGKPCAGSADQILLFPLDAEDLWTMYDWVTDRP